MQLCYYENMLFAGEKVSPGKVIRKNLAMKVALGREQVRECSL